MLSSALTLDATQPLNKHHAIARDLQWAVVILPHLFGKQRLINLLDVPGPLTSGRHALINNATVSMTQGLQPTTAPGLWGEYRFVEDTQYAEVPDTASLQLNNIFTLFFVLYLNSPGISGGSLISKFVPGAGSPSSDTGIRCIRFQAGSLWVSAFNTNWLSWAYPASALNKWISLAVVSRSGGSSLYVNTTLTSSGSQITNWFNTTGALRIGTTPGQAFGSGTGSFHGRLQSVFLWNRALSVQELTFMHHEAFQAYPTLLNRVTTRAFGQAAQSAYYYNWRRRAA